MAIQESIQQETDILAVASTGYSLILWNDDVNTFDWVIKALVDICDFDETQAEQCSLIIHYNGKCDVQVGEYHRLKLKCDAFTDRGINATVEEMASH